MGEQDAVGAPPDVPLVPFHDAYPATTPFRGTTHVPAYRRFLPFLGTVKGYGAVRLRIDATAGLTVAALALPASMAYAGVAGLPVTSGLYALLLPLVAYALFGSARWLSVGPDGTVALMIAAGLTPMAAIGTPEYTSLAAALAVAVGLVYLIGRLIRIGWIADYFSQAVLVGYITGVAVLMIVGQLGKLVGLSSDKDNAILETIDIAKRLGDSSVPTVIVALVSLALLLVFGRWMPKAPAALVVVVLGISASWWLDLAADGVAVTGTVPSGLPAFEIPHVPDGAMLQLIGVAVGIFLVGYSDSILTARAFAARRGDTIDADQELVAFSGTNIAAGFTQAMPVNTSGSRTAVNLDMGATSQVSGLVAGGAVAAILLFLTTPIAYLPAAVLGAIIVVASAKLIDPSAWAALAQGSKAEFVIGILTTLAVINLGVLQALVLAVLLSVFDVIRRTASPHDAVLGWSPGAERYADVSDATDTEVTPGVVVYRFSDRLFFANVHYFTRRVWAAIGAAPQPVGHLVLDLGGVPGVDASAATALRDLHTQLEGRGMTLDIAHATAFLTDRMDRFGLVDEIREEHFHPTVVAAVESVAPAVTGRGAGVGAESTRLARVAGPAAAARNVTGDARTGSPVAVAGQGVSPSRTEPMRTAPAPTDPTASADGEGASRARADGAG